MKRDDQIFDIIAKEHQRQVEGIELIASENFVSDQVLEAMGSVLTNKYAEGLPFKRYYGGCQNVDLSEQLAIDRLKKLFGVEWANVQPHSGASANFAVILACVNPGDTILGFQLSHGGHLTHGSPVNFSGKHYNTTFYGVDKKTGTVDYDKMEETAIKEKPKLIICGASAYCRDWDYARFREIADKVGAILWADIAHPAGLIASGLLNNPVDHCHILTSTTHKTLRGPRGGVIMLPKDYENPFGLKNKKGELRMMSSVLDGAVFPGAQGGPLEHIIAAKAIAFGEALTDEFKEYSKQVMTNAKIMCKEFAEKGYKIVSGDTENHCLLIDLTSMNITGKTAQNALVRADITVNRNAVPFDTTSPFITSGIRLGTPAITTRGVKETEIPEIVNLIDRVLSDPDNDGVTKDVRGRVNELMSNRPLFAY